MARKLSTCALTSAVNASAYESAKDEKVRALLRFIQTNEPGEDDFTQRLSEFVAKVKENEKFRKEFADMNLHDFDIMTEAKEEGLAEGARQNAVENATNLIKMGILTLEQISQATGVQVDELQEIAAKASVTA